MVLSLTALVVGVAGGLIAGHRLGSDDAELALARRDNAALEDRVASLEEDRAALESERDLFGAENAQLQREEARFDEREKRLRSARKRLSAAAADLRSERRDLRARTEQLESRAAELRRERERILESSIEDGIWQVGVDVEPGIYRADGGSSCYWALLRSADTRAIINNGGFAPNQTLRIRSPWFQTNDCGRWTKLN
jgi:hypothetical protein